MPPLLLPPCPSAGSEGWSSFLTRVWECVRPGCSILLSGCLYNDAHGSLTSERTWESWGEGQCLAL